MSRRLPVDMIGARLLQPRLPLYAALAIAGLVILATVLPFPASAQETVSISGRVVNGTAGADIPVDLAVLMLITATDGTLQGTGQTVMEPDGTFLLEEVPLVDEGTYNLSVDYGGVFYGASLAPSEMFDQVEIIVHEPTEDATIIQVQRQVMVISEIDVAERVVTATEFVRFTNPTDRTLRPNLETARPGMFSFMRFALPPNAADVTVQSNLRGGEIISVGSGFALTAAVPPGQHSVDFAYTFPYEGGSLEYRNSLPQGVEIFQVLVPEEWASVEIGGLSPRPPVAIGNEVYQAWEGRDIPAGPGVRLAFQGLPQPGIGARLGRTLSGGSFWLTTIPSAVGAVLLAFLIFGLARRSSPAVADGYPESPDEAAASAIAEGQRAVLVSELAALDQRFEQGELEDIDYFDRRAELVSRALGGPRESET